MRVVIKENTGKNSMFTENNVKESFNQKKFEAELVGALKKFNAKSFNEDEYRFLRYDGDVDDAVRLAAFTSAKVKQEIMTDVEGFKNGKSYHHYVRALGNPVVTMELLKDILKFNTAGEIALISKVREDSERHSVPLDIAAEVAKAEKQAEVFNRQEQTFSHGLEQYGLAIADMLSAKCR